MPRFEEIIKRAEGLGLPIAHNEFTDTKKNPAPDPPFLCWLSDERTSGPDNKIRIRTVDGALELYTDRRDDPELEKRIEEEVFFDTEYEKQQGLIRSENMVQTAYVFSVVEKIRREIKNNE